MMQQKVVDMPIHTEAWMMSVPDSTIVHSVSAHCANCPAAGKLKTSQPLQAAQLAVKLKVMRLEMYQTLKALLMSPSYVHPHHRTT